VQGGRASHSKEGGRVSFPTSKEMGGKYGISYNQKNRHGRGALSGERSRREFLRGGGITKEEERVKSRGSKTPRKRKKQKIKAKAQGNYKKTKEKQPENKKGNKETNYQGTLKRGKGGSQLLAIQKRKRISGNPKVKHSSTGGPRMGTLVELCLGTSKAKKKKAERGAGRGVEEAA